MSTNGQKVVFPVRDYDLAATLTSGQVFRWRQRHDAWIGVVGSHWVRLRTVDHAIIGETAEPVSDWSWLAEYLQVHAALDPVLAGFPKDEPMQLAATACRGLRLLRQSPWECLASFILTSTKQIVQIQQIIALLCERFGAPLTAPASYPAAYAFPTPARLAAATEADLRACKTGFRALHLLAVARMVHDGRLDLEQVRSLTLEEARAELMKLQGVGRKIADCVLLFAYGFPEAFPMDVWVLKALRNLYFPGRCVTAGELQQFAAVHFGRHAGYAQQYLFHYMRVTRPRVGPAAAGHPHADQT